MATAIFLHYNNYYNRLLKKENNLAAYRDYRIIAPNGVAYSEYTNINFDPRDGVNTELNVNWFGDEADYLVISEDGVTISSRWFILEQTRNLKGQKHCSLRRDLLADYWDNLENSPIFIEKGICRQDDPAIFNKEDMTFNQIKTKQVPLYDATGCSWLVIYYQSKMLDDGPVTINWKSELQPQFYTTDITTWKFYNNSNLGGNTALNIRPDPSNVSWTSEILTRWNRYRSYDVKIDGYGNSSVTNSHVDSQLKTLGYLTSSSGNIDQYVIENFMKYFAADAKDPDSSTIQAVNFYSTALDFSGLTFMDQSDENDLNNYNGKYIKDTTTGNTYKITVNKVVGESVGPTILGTGTWPVTTFKAAFSNAFDVINQTYPGLNLTLNEVNGQMRITVKRTTATITLSNVVTGNYSLTIPKTVKATQDAPYNILALPYADDTIFYDGDNNMPNRKRVVLDFATQLAVDKGGFIYDIQLVPYAGLSGIAKNGIDLTGQTLDEDYELIKYVVSETDKRNYGFAYNLTQSSFTDFIKSTTQIGSARLDEKYGPDIKILNETKVVRLCSPNYSSVFEYSPVKAGEITYLENNNIAQYNIGPFYISCTLKPFEPFIQVQPEFSVLYGENFVDNRGLICGGDFSLPIVSDAWTSYVNNNKNYLNAFNRQIENMEINNKLNNINSIGNTATSIGAGIVGGLMSGTGPAGAFAGAATGLIKSGLSIGTTLAAQREAIDYTKDQFAYSMGNIQAQPQTLARVSSFNINNITVPFIEIYDCTDIEKKAFINKIKYNGMTVMRIGKISDFVNSWTYTGLGLDEDFTITESYIKGKLIRLEGVYDDYHLINELSNELYQGIFVPVNN